MSDTDKTRPWRVRIAERADVTAVAHHDHRYGPCDLPELAAHHPTTNGDASTPRRCKWWPGRPVLYGRDNGCGCRMCTGFFERRAERRAERRTTRETLRAVVRDPRLRTSTPDPFEPDILPRRPRW